MQPLLLVPCLFREGVGVNSWPGARKSMWLLHPARCRGLQVLRDTSVTTWQELGTWRVGRVASSLTLHHCRWETPMGGSLLQTLCHLLTCHKGRCKDELWLPSILSPSDFVPITQDLMDLSRQVTKSYSATPSSCIIPSDGMWEVT